LKVYQNLCVFDYVRKKVHLIKFRNYESGELH
jgi:hypothetical protein